MKRISRCLSHTKKESQKVEVLARIVFSITGESRENVPQAGNGIKN
jgi:hypothetical protein